MLQKAFYNERFENRFYCAKGIEFQSFFERLMSLAYKEDFLACRPWGNRGDKKNDGFLKSKRCLFQVYAPYELSEKEAVKKITEDFEGAKIHWGRYFSKWVFVHNAPNGLPPHIHQVLLNFEQENEPIKITSWGLEELRTVFKTINISDLPPWLGYAPTEEAKNNLGFSDLKAVLDSIKSNPSPRFEPVRDVPMGKLEANSLSEDTTNLIKAGMTKTHLVEQFFNQSHNATYGEGISASFKSIYNELRTQYTPIRIFSKFQSWAGGDNLGTPEHQIAVLAVIAYFFERCDIYEEPRG